MRQRKKTRVLITKGEKILYTTAGIASFLALFVIPYLGSAKVGNLSLSIEKTKYEITEQEKTNESLTMQVNELTSFANIKDIVNQMGLAYNNDNIVVVDK